jgi:hypothetical protein
LPAMLLFESDLEKEKRIEARFLRGQALVGLDREKEAKDLLWEVLRMDRNHAGATDLMEQLQERNSVVGTSG